MTYFYPRPPRGGRLSKSGTNDEQVIFLSTPSARRATLDEIYHALHDSISIHALREEGDGLQKALSEIGEISIHALREEGDSKSTHCQSERMYFYPRPPRGGRRETGAMSVTPINISIHALREEGDLAVQAATITLKAFLSTPSARRATQTYLP